MAKLRENQTRDPESLTNSLMRTISREMIKMSGISLYGPEYIAFRGLVMAGVSMAVAKQKKIKPRKKK